jgi:hypothetical protein
MLSAEHRAIVKATVPLLETGGEALIKHFYIPKSGRTSIRRIRRAARNNVRWPTAS